MTLIVYIQTHRHSITICSLYKEANMQEGLRTYSDEPNTSPMRPVGIRSQEFGISIGFSVRDHDAQVGRSGPVSVLRGEHHVLHEPYGAGGVGFLASRSRPCVSHSLGGNTPYGSNAYLINFFFQRRNTLKIPPPPFMIYAALF